MYFKVISSTANEPINLKVGLQGKYKIILSNASDGTPMNIYDDNSNLLKSDTINSGEVKIYEEELSENFSISLGATTKSLDYNIFYNIGGFNND